MLKRKTKICQRVIDHCDLKKLLTTKQINQVWPHVSKCRRCTVNVASMIQVLSGRKMALRFLGVKK